MLKVYLAGPDVFYPDNMTRKNRLLDLCQENGFVGFYPGENDITPPDANAIRLANIDMIKRADCVLANLTPFRGFEPDSGTVFEVGFATALGKTIVGYSNDVRPMIERLREHQSLSKTQMTDKDGLFVENFDLPNNLMFGDIVLATTPEEALQKLKTLVNH